MSLRKAVVAVDDSVVGCCGTLGTKVLSTGESDDLAQIFGALADPARLRMLSMIASADEVCSCALEAPLEKSQPTISHHTRILAAAGLIVGERRGRWTWWRAVPERLEAVARLLSD
jgi:ArsR family transcriptional regulator